MSRSGPCRTPPGPCRIEASSRNVGLGGARSGLSTCRRRAGSWGREAVSDEGREEPLSVHGSRITDHVHRSRLKSDGRGMMGIFIVVRLELGLAGGAATASAQRRARCSGERDAQSSGTWLSRRRLLPSSCSNTSQPFRKLASIRCARVLGVSTCQTRQRTPAPSRKVVKLMSPPIHSGQREALKPPT